MQETILEAMSNISGKMQGLEMSTQIISDFNIQEDGLLQTLENHNKAQAHCLEVCTSALDETNTHGSGTLTVRLARALGNSRQLIAATVGNAGPGQATVHADTAIAEGQADQAMVGSASQEFALGFFASRQPRGDAGEPDSSLPKRG